MCVFSKDLFSLIMTKTAT